MELRQLSYFLAAAQTQNFRKAAELCLVTQPALSRQIAALEKELGIALFTREKQHVRLTAAGQALTEYARQATELLQQGEQELVRWQQGQRGVVHIGCNPSLAAIFLPPLLASFRAQYPDIQLIISVDHSDEVIGLVEQGEVDLGLLYDPAVRSELVVIKELFRQPLHVLVPCQHPLTRLAAGECTLARIVTEPLILLDKGARLRKVLDRLFLQRGITVQPVIEIASDVALRELVRQGAGVTLIPPALLWQSQEQGQDGSELLPIADVAETFTFALAYRRVGTLSVAARQFMNAVLKTTATYQA
ncbi:MAG TPA: LysR family transcriptional regulator [Ktedonobacteraceae bacterium]|jgi:DNA-binding transcriptional LysR family regulator|nr:LysR family transcriptional regulator [Ktedonobacteraceae bacterium]